MREVAVAMPEAGTTDVLREMETDERVSLKEYPMVPGNTIRLRGTAADNRSQGTQTGQSRWLTFQVVTPEELFYEILMVQRRSARSSAPRSRRKRPWLRRSRRRADSEQLSGLNRQHQIATRQVSQIANRLDATLQEMTLNDLGSTQMREILASGIIAPMRELQRTPDRLTCAVARSAGGRARPIERARATGDGGWEGHCRNDVADSGPDGTMGKLC